MQHELKTQHDELQRQRDALQRQIDLFEQRKAQAAMDLAAQRATFLGGPLQHRKSDSPIPSREVLQYSLHVRSASGDNVSPQRVKETNLDNVIMAFENKGNSGTSETPVFRSRPLSGTPGRSASLSRRDSVPLHLFSATNEQKFGSSNQIQVRQSTPPATRNSLSSVQQILPMKLSSSQSSALNNRQTGSSGSKPVTLNKTLPTGIEGVQSGQYILQQSSVNNVSGKQQTEKFQTVKTNYCHSDGQNECSSISFSSSAILPCTSPTSLSNVLKHTVGQPEETFL